MTFCAKLAQSLGARKVIGVDIDDSLITAAWKRRRSIWTQQEPDFDSSYGSETPRPSKKKEIHEALSDVRQADYFPASCEHMFGALPIPAHKSKSTAFPHNVVFRCADWVTTEIAEDAEGYDVVVAYVSIQRNHVKRE